MCVLMIKKVLQEEVAASDRQPVRRPCSSKHDANCFISGDTKLLGIAP
jgi:hypothetical protein